MAAPAFTVPVHHPAPFSPTAVERLAELVDLYLPHRPIRLLDPMAGIGTVHRLADLLGPGVDTTGIELEPEWAHQHERTIVGDATKLPFNPATFDAVVCSPAYGNRLADDFKATNPRGRLGYARSLGHELSPGNGAALQWGEPYRDLHRRAWAETARVLRPGGFAFIVVKDHIRARARVPVVAFHRGALAGAGLCIVEHVPIPARHYGFGANGRERAEHEIAIVATKAVR